MSILEDIYSNRVNEKCILSSEKKIDEEIFELMRLHGYHRDDDKMSDLLFQSSGSGQQYGFYAGFQTAVALLLECLSY